jgi:HEPN domain-containing protein
MPPKDSPYPQDWFRIADKELKPPEHLLSVDDPEGAGYHLQQAVEKYLKGFLLSKGWKLKRIHDLEVLLNDGLKYEKTFEKYRSLCQKITAYYVIDRYPLPSAPTLTPEKIGESIAEAKELIQQLRSFAK